eukprot:CAMPEP_0172555822 /NCGR_PEP_ID=MMETSP1067-20121228/60499_1 /TAXON_ID=265564 ORGANISM="Thalassiosira punctigera, Strain Tpunct2005C2" /NCGR_SAMPLE_ID=MMETSP1067 /ASSEMBLY_ACC=CAM_ASM_000444 /LENGTH=62 /DNA_ID=CAMNT_0013344427 /DNA_START=77 /DNA_END=262 /DNA_ORIENTATION=-
MPNVNSCNPGEPGNFAPSFTAESHPSNQSRLVDHAYHDFSCYLECGGGIAKHKKSENNFPAK